VYANVVLFEDTIDLKLGSCSTFITAWLVGIGPGRFASIRSAAITRSTAVSIVCFLRISSNLHDQPLVPILIFDAKLLSC
jgi:hypothetical protein